MWRPMGGPPQVGAAPSGTPAGTSPMASISGAGAPVDGVTGVGVADKGTFYFDETNAQWYTNTGSAAAPVWSPLIQG